VTILAFTGRAGTGKTTTARVLCRDHGFQRIGFADPIRAMMRALYVEMDLPFDEIDRRLVGDLKNAPDPALGHTPGRFYEATPRRAMQTLGTEWGRMCMGQSFWTGVWLRSVESSGAHRVIVDDCRFHDEAEAIRRLGGQVIGLRREGVEPLPGSHISETGTEPDHWIDMNGTPESTATKVLLLASLKAA
jgi:hypothetical protein